MEKQNETDMTRTIKLELSDEECERLAEMAGKGGLSVSETISVSISTHKYHHP